MTGKLIIKPQRYEVNGHAPLTYGIFLETDRTFDGIECWQDCAEVFVAYSWTAEGAQRAIQEIQQAGPERGDVVSQSVTRLGVAMDLDEFERLAKLYVEERFTYDRRLLELLRLSDFILWLRQRQRESVAAATSRKE